MINKLPREYKNLSNLELRNLLLKYMNDNDYLLKQNHIIIQRAKEIREDMRDSVVDQPSFLDLYKGVSPHT
jgi:hypothetical protein